MAITTTMGTGPTTITPTVKRLSKTRLGRPTKVGNNYAPASASTPLIQIKSEP
jgi:hypothetical protein